MLGREEEVLISMVMICGVKRIGNNVMGVNLIPINLYTAGTRGVNLITVNPWVL